jgi:hypothetical protein
VDGASKIVMPISSSEPYDNARASRATHGVDPVLKSRLEPLYVARGLAPKFGRDPDGVSLRWFVAQGAHQTFPVGAKGYQVPRLANPRINRGPTTAVRPLSGDLA